MQDNVETARRGRRNSDFPERWGPPPETRSEATIRTWILGKIKKDRSDPEVRRAAQRANQMRIQDAQLEGLKILADTMRGPSRRRP